MRIVSVTEAAKAINAKSGGKAPAEDDPLLLTQVLGLLPRIETACGVKSLVRGAWVDYFQLRETAASPVGRRIKLRLDNGFLDPDVAVVITDPAGVETTVAAEDRDDELGVIYMESCETGIHTVSYTSGFALQTYEPTNPELTDPASVDSLHPLMEGIPQWMKEAAFAYLVQWFRATILSPKQPKDAAAGRDLSNNIRDEVFSRMYGRYNRPRISVWWAYKSVAAV